MLERLHRFRRIALLAAVGWTFGCGSSDASPPSAGTPAPPPTSDDAGADGAADAPDQRTTDLHFKTFGDRARRAVVILHGGPGGNNFSFEEITAQPLADRGNFVITYDQRGSGRSPKGAPADFTYDRFTQDLDDLLHALKVSKPIFIGLSWGGTLAVKYMERFPDVAKGALLVGNPVDFPATVFNIHARTLKIHKDRFQSTEAEAVEHVHARMFPNGLRPPYEFSENDILITFEHARQCGLYSPSIPTLESLGIYGRLAVHPDFALVQELKVEVAQAFHRNEKLFHENFVALFAKLSPRLYGIYGAEDGLFDAAQLERITSILSPAHMTIVQGASHGVPFDKPDVFMDAALSYMEQLDKL